MSDLSPGDAILANLRAMPKAEPMRIDATMHRLQWNENAEGFPADLKEEALARLARMDWARYPVQGRPFDLCARIAEHLDVPAASIVVTGGSSELIPLVLNALLSERDTIVMHTPIFGMYRRYIRQSGAQLVEVQTWARDDFALPVDEIVVAARTNEAKVVLLCSPNNPTGTVHPLVDLERIVVESGAVVVLDAAYVEFSPVDLMPLARAHPNVIMLRTFSKAYAMAGVRVGYAVANPTVAEHLQKVVPSFPIGVFPEMVAMLALDHADRFLEGARRIVVERERLAAELAAIPGMRVYASGTNFLLVEPPVSGALILDHLRTEQRVLLSDVSGQPGLDGFVRISVGTPEQNELVVRGFSEAIDGAVVGSR